MNKNPINQGKLWCCIIATVTTKVSKYGSILTKMSKKRIKIIQDIKFNINKTIKEKT